jgi:choline kinase
MHSEVSSKLGDGFTFIQNPFYEVTNSMASLWFAREYLDGLNDCVIINGDIVTEERMVRDVICRHPMRPCVLIDSSIKSEGDYNVQVHEEKIVVMSKELNEYHGEYAGITQLDKKTTILLHKALIKFVDEGQYCQWYENALVQMIFRDCFSLYYTDICEFKWTEVDSVSDLMLAKRILADSQRESL